MLSRVLALMDLDPRHPTDTVNVSLSEDLRLVGLLRSWTAPWPSRAVRWRFPIVSVASCTGMLCGQQCHSCSMCRGRMGGRRRGSLCCCSSLSYALQKFSNVQFTCEARPLTRPCQQSRGSLVSARFTLPILSRFLRAPDLSCTVQSGNAAISA